MTHDDKNVLLSSNTLSSCVTSSSCEIHSELTQLINHLRQRFPSARVKLDAPDNPNGEHWIDVITDQGRASFAWRPAFGFGFYAEDAGFGEGPETIVKNHQDAARYAEDYVRQRLGQPELPHS